MKPVSLLLVIAALLFCACDDSQRLADGMRTIVSGGTTRSYYLKLPAGYTGRSDSPLVIALHGTGGDSNRYLENEYYNLQGAVGDEAILVYPEALAQGDSEPQWNYTDDLVFFDDLVVRLKETVSFDHRKLFVVGHSSGAGFAHQIACRRGDLIRAMAAVAGGLMDDTDCRGEVAIIQIHGRTDEMIPLSAILPGRNYWLTYNGCDTGEPVEVAPAPCQEFTGCDAHFPVRYCEHGEEDPERHGGHAWPSFAGQAIWSFFDQLDPREPSDTPGSGAERATLASTVVPITFTLIYPEDFSPPPVSMGLALGPPGAKQPIEKFPDHFLTTQKITIDEYDIGGQTRYTVDANFTDVDVPGEYTLGIVVFVEGSTWPVPTWHRDYVGLRDVSIDDYLPIVIEEPIPLEPVLPPSL